MKTSTKVAIDDERAAQRKDWLDAIETRRRETPKDQAVVIAEQKKLRKIVGDYERDVVGPQRATDAARQRMLDYDAEVATRELALRRSADPRIALLVANLTEYWDKARRRATEESEVTELRAKVKAAVARLGELQLALNVDVDAELASILADTGIRTIELHQLALGWPL